VVCLSVGRSVTVVSDVAKTDEPIEMPFGLWARVHLRNHALDGRPHSPLGRGNFEEGKGRPIVKYRDTLHSAVQKTAEPIEMLFGLLTRASPGNHVLDGGIRPLIGRGNFSGEKTTCCVPRDPRVRLGYTSPHRKG